MKQENLYTENKDLQKTVSVTDSLLNPPTSFVLRSFFCRHPIAGNLYTSKILFLTINSYFVIQSVKTTHTFSLAKINARKSY